jgi:hypothetical protein
VVNRKDISTNVRRRRAARLDIILDEVVLNVVPSVSRRMHDCVKLWLSRMSRVEC